MKKTNQDLAHKIKEKLKSQGYTVKLTHCYEIVAELMGQKDWNTAKASGQELAESLPMKSDSRKNNLLALSRESINSITKGDLSSYIMNMLEKKAKNGEVKFRMSQSDIIAMKQLGLLENLLEALAFISKSGIEIESKFLTYTGKKELDSLTFLWGVDANPKLGKDLDQFLEEIRLNLNKH